jgi:hypothetical protein
MQRRAPLFTLALLLPACADPGSDTGDTTTDASTSTSTGDPNENAAVTYHRDIKPILERSCTGCHSPGNIAPFSLQTYEQARPFAPALAASVMDATMPPWPPANTCNTYEHDRSLPDAQRQLIADWAGLGAPEGDPADAPAPAAPEIDEVVYDVELALPVAYSPTIAPDEYRCFVLDWPADQLKYITGFRATPGETSIVHHVIAFTVPPAETAEFAALDAADPDPGYLCYGGPGGKRPNWLGSWVPGSNAGALPEGSGLRVEPGSKIVVQMHYHTLPGAAADRTVINLRTADTVERVANVVPFTNPGWITGQTPMEIPAGDAEVEQAFSVDLSKALPLLAPGGDLDPAAPVLLHAAAVHMHTLGVSGSITIDRADGGSECALEVPRWDFDWQGSYQLVTPITVHPGDKLTLSCKWDNSAGAAPVYWGEGTGDEMCLGVVYLTN